MQQPLLLLMYVLPHTLCRALFDGCCPPKLERSFDVTSLTLKKQILPFSLLFLFPTIRLSGIATSNGAAPTIESDSTSVVITADDLSVVTPVSDG